VRARLVGAPELIVENRARLVVERLGGAGIDAVQRNAADQRQRRAAG